MLDATGREQPTPDHEGLYLLVLSWAEALLGRYAPAAAHAERALRGVRERGDTHLLALLLNTLAYVHYQSGRMTQALSFAQKGRACARSAGRADHENFSDAITAAAWAQAHPDAGDPRRRREGAPPTTPHTALNAMLLAESSLAVGDKEAALALLLPRRDAPWMLEPEAVLAPRGYELLAAAALDSGTRPDVIAGWVAQASDAAAVIGLPEAQGHALLARGHLSMSRRLPAEAAQWYAQAHKLLGDERPRRGFEHASWPRRQLPAPRRRTCSASSPSGSGRWPGWRVAVGGPRRSPSSCG
jgi:tetratricopeptide (TPR) repeat protein